MQPNENRIRERAYQLWEQDGKPDGCADKHWNLACQYEQEQAQSFQPDEQVNDQYDAGNSTFEDTHHTVKSNKKKHKH